MQKLCSVGAALALVVFASQARATWIESGDVDLVIVGGGGGNEGVEAADVEAQDDMVLVSVGATDPGEITVVGEGSITDPKVLGNFYVYEFGTANIQTVFGTTNLIEVRGVLNVLNSQLEPDWIHVFDGTVNLTASVVPGISLNAGSSLHAQLGSRLGGLQTQEDTNTMIEGSIVSSPLECRLFGSTFVFEDSILHCKNITVTNVATEIASVDVYRVLSPFVTVETDEELAVWSGTLDIEYAVVTTGSLEIGAGGEAQVGASASLWTNAGGTALQPGGTVAPIQLAIGGGTDFHELADVRVAGHPGTQHLVVGGAGTELEIDGDLHIGEIENHLGNPADFTGNVTVSNGAEVIVHGELLVRPQGVLTIESGATVYAATVTENGAINENGGTLVLPEAASMLGALAALAALAGSARRRRVRSRRSIAVAAALLAGISLAGAAHATWTESGDVDIAIVNPGGGIEYVEADEVEEQDDMALVSVGSGFPGEFTVVGEGSITDPKVLGDIYVYEGTGDIQSVIGIVGVLRVGDRAGAGTIGVLTILNSSLEEGNLRVFNGTANLIGSVIDRGADVLSGSSLYLSLGSRIGSLSTSADTYTSIVGSAVASSFPCQLFSTVVVEDSLLRCREINIDNVGTDTTNVDIRAIGVPFVTVEVAEEFEVNGGTVDVENANVTTGSLRVASDDADLGIAVSHWTNAGNTVIAPGTGNRLALGAGSRFHELGLVRVAGVSSDFQNLIVSGDGTELEVEGDLRIGETLNLQSNPVDILGNVTVSNGAEVIVHGELLVRSQGVLTIESGATVYATSVAGTGTITENGGVLVVPEASAALGCVAALSALALRARGRRS